MERKTVVDRCVDISSRYPNKPLSNVACTIIIVSPSLCVPIYYLQCTALGRPDTINGDQMLKYHTDDGDGTSTVMLRTADDALLLSFTGNYTDMNPNNGWSDPVIFGVE